MEKIAIISDIHGNLQALTAVLEDIKKREISHIYCLGDIGAKGVFTHECIKLIQEHCEVVIQGNCDDYISKDYKDSEITPRIAFNRNLTTQSDRDYLAHLPFSYEFYLSGSKIRLYHASNTSFSKFIGAASSQEEEYEMFDDGNSLCDVVIYGHTHTPYINKAYHHTLINAGSVGNSMDVFQDEMHQGRYEETNKAYYLILEGFLDSKEDGPMSYSYVRIPYDIGKELDNTRENPEKDAYENELRYGKYRDLHTKNIRKK